MSTKNDLYWILSRLNVSNEQIDLITKIRKLDKLTNVYIHSYGDISKLEKKKMENGCEIEVMATVDPSLRTIDDLDAYLEENRMPDYAKNEGMEMDKGSTIELEYILGPVHEVKVVFHPQNFK